MNEVLYKITPRITDDVSNILLALFTTLDVKIVVDAMDPNKTSSSDGMTASFFQFNWDIVGYDITRAILSFLHDNQTLGVLNHTQS